MLQFVCSNSLIVAQLVVVWLSEQEVPSSILGDFNICFDFPLIYVAIPLNICKIEHLQRKGGKGHIVNFH